MFSPSFDGRLSLVRRQGRKELGQHYPIAQTVVDSKLGARRRIEERLFRAATVIS